MNNNLPKNKETTISVMWLIASFAKIIAKKSIHQTKQFLTQPRACFSLNRQTRVSHIIWAFPSQNINEFP